MTVRVATDTVKGYQTLFAKSRSLGMPHDANLFQNVRLTLRSGNQCLYYRPNIIHCKCDLAAGYKLHEGKCVLDQPNPDLCNPGNQVSANEEPDTCGAGQCLYNDPVSHLKK